MLSYRDEGVDQRVWILHVNNVAGVPSLLVQGLRQNGIKADLVGRIRNPYGFPHETIIDVPATVFSFRLLRLSRDYSILHFHGLSYRVFNIDVFALKALGTNLVIHLHGTEIRNSHNKLSTRVALKICNKVLVGTTDLLSYCPRAVWLPTPIDPVFKPFRNPQRYGKALYFKKWYEPEKEEWVRKECEKMGLKLTVQRKPIPYRQMHRFLNQFEVFFDRFTIPSLSKTALEALACGCKVVSWKGSVTNPKEILKNHSLPVVTKRLIRIYEEILG